MNTVAQQPMYGWKTIAWKQVERRSLSSKSAFTEPNVVAMSDKSARSKDC